MLAIASMLALFRLMLAEAIFSHDLIAKPKLVGTLSAGY
jgi:hypothetical protein